MNRSRGMPVLLTMLAIALLATGAYKDNQALSREVGQLDWEAWLTELLA